MDTPKPLETLSTIYDISALKQGMNTQEGVVAWNKVFAYVERHYTSTYEKNIQSLDMENMKGTVYRKVLEGVKFLETVSDDGLEELIQNIIKNATLESDVVRQLKTIDYISQKTQNWLHEET